MENESKNLNNINTQRKISNIHPKSINYFSDWVSSHYVPNCIVYSTETGKEIIGKNNLTPAQFMRPFGNFSGTNINFSVGEKFTMNLKNFKLDFFDSQSFESFSNKKVSEVIENMLFCKKITPDWNLSSLTSISKCGKNNIEPFFQNIKNYSYPWYHEYEKTLLESLKFNEYEMYQQPFANIYICSIKDEKEHIEALKKQEAMPRLMQEGILETKIPAMVLVLNDKSIDSGITNEYIYKKLQNFSASNPNAYVICLDINTNSTLINDSKNEDIWFKCFHKLEIYINNNNNTDPSNTSESETGFSSQKSYGLSISLEERENFKSTILKFFNDYIKHFLQRLVVDLDDEISSNKKGIKNGFLSIFKKSEKVEFVNHYKIYKLTVMEKKLYLLSLIQFYFRDYENAMDHLKILMNDIKSKSVEHYNSILELYTICHFICSPGSKKDVEIDAAYNNYLKSKNLKYAARAVIIQIKMLEHLKRFSEIPKILIRATGEIISTPYVTPIFFEKASIYFLLNNQQVRKFLFFQILSAMAYKNMSGDLKKYSLNCMGNVIPFFDKNSPSFLRFKEFLNSNMGEICMNIEYFEGALKFYKNSIELSTVKNVDQDQALYIRHFLKSLNSISHGGGLSYVEIKFLSIPEIVNSTLSVIEEQDYEIGNIKTYHQDEISSGELNLNWANFFKYSKVELNKTYLTLSENDILVLKNLDNIVQNRQNFSNSSSKRNFTANVGKKIYVRFLIKNPLNLNLSISSMKLECDFIIDKNFKELPINTGTQNCIEYEEKSLLLEKNSSSLVTIYCIPKYPGKVILKGLEIGLYKIALFKHSFTTKNVSQLYEDNHRPRSLSTRSSNSSNSDIIKKLHHSHGPLHPNVFNNISKNISFEIIDDNQDIKISFPKGKEISLYTNEIFLIPIKIKNSSNIKIKKFCLFLDDRNVAVEEDLNNTQKRRVGNISDIKSNLLSHVIFKENEIRKDNECEVTFKNLNYIGTNTNLSSISRRILYKIFN